MYKCITAILLCDLTVPIIQSLAHAILAPFMLNIPRPRCPTSLETNTPFIALQLFLLVIACLSSCCLLP